MKSHEILPAGFGQNGGYDGKKTPKSYEIMPRPGLAMQGLERDAWTEGRTGKGACGCAGCKDPGAGLSTPKYGRDPIFDWPDPLVDHDTIPRWRERCNAYDADTHALRLRLAGLSGSRINVQRDRDEFSQAAMGMYNPNIPCDSREPTMLCGPCIAFQQAHQTLNNAATTAYMQGNHAASNNLGRNATRFHDDVWLRCDASRPQQPRALYEAAVAVLDEALRDLDYDIGDLENEIAGRQRNRLSHCPFDVRR